jgi:outer membrane protein insertion porin family
MITLMVKFKKLLFFIVLFSAFINVTLKAEVVNKIEVFGNDRISLETIKIFGDVNIGENYETSDISQIIKKLYETKFFSNISIKLQNNTLQITVNENPMINLVTFNGEKTKKYKEALTEILSLSEKTSFIKSFVKSDVNIIKEFYRNLGFYFIEIDLQIEKLDKNRVNLVYTFNKGEKAKISKIFFLGDKKIRDMKLRDVITSQEARFWKFISRNIYLNKGRIELDKRLLINYYKNIGYYEVDIASSSVEYSEGEGFVLSYSINAGKRYKFKKIYASVADELDKSAFVSLQKDFDEVIGEYYSQSKVTKILEKVDKLSEQKELQFVNHRLLETLDGDGVEININIFEGKKFTIERVNIVGNSITNDGVIRGELEVDEGDPYSALLVNKSINNLKARRIFANVEEKIIEGSLPDLKVLEITVQEKATGEISAGAGVGTDGTSFMFAVKENNWLGKGVSVQTKLNISPETLRGSLGFKDPNYKFSNNAVFGTFSLASADFLETSGYESSKTGLSLGTSFEQYEDLYFFSIIIWYT